ncbi:hypothetical protein DL765_007644 [Monosporascus sp. GIB2]|nr:hypothetical protein DL765_007644 [Monosporascus sp. GIB2]
MVLQTFTLITRLANLRRPRSEKWSRGWVTSEQLIQPDAYLSGAWGVTMSMVLNIQILESVTFTEVTGMPPPPTPSMPRRTPSTTTRSSRSGGGEHRRQGGFSEAKSVTQVDAQRARGRSTGYEEESVLQRLATTGRFSGNVQAGRCPHEEVGGSSRLETEGSQYKLVPIFYERPQWPADVVD